MIHYNKIIDKSIDLKKLNYQLPDWSRVIWSSENARSIWESKLQRAAIAFNEIEERAVLKGFRDSALIYLPDSALLEKSKFYAKNGLVLQILTKSGIADSYSSTSIPWTANQPFVYRCVLTSARLLPDWIDAWDTGNDTRIGQLLNYPSCCIKFFTNVWNTQRLVDTTWPMFQNTLDMNDIDYRSNILLRWVGIRLVSHLPCSFNCQETAKIAATNQELFKSYHKDLLDDINNLLEMPVEWSAKHGIAEIKTPIFKISSRTDATSDLYVVQKPGEFYPTESPSGTKFPYINTQKNLITLSKSFNKSIAAVNPALKWTDNGFSSEAAMDKAHGRILEFIRTRRDAYVPETGISVSSIIDLGCGNGRLLEKIQTHFCSDGVFSLHGVEINSDVAKRAQFTYPEFHIYNANIFDWTWTNTPSYQLGLISENRIDEEMNSGRLTRTQILAKLRGICKHLIVYSYETEQITHHSSMQTAELL